MNKLITTTTFFLLMFSKYNKCELRQEFVDSDALFLIDFYAFILLLVSERYLNKLKRCAVKLHLY